MAGVVFRRGEFLNQAIDAAYLERLEEMVFNVIEENSQAIALFVQNLPKEEQMNEHSVVRNMAVALMTLIAIRKERRETPWRPVHGVSDG